jgi:succinate dehydrogenase/fumarate reductase flavoprotein subunit
MEAVAMVKLALLIAQSALMRKESRGAHCIEDHPEQNDRDYMKNVVVRRKENGEGEFNLAAVTGVS